MEGPKQGKDDEDHIYLQIPQDLIDGNVELENVELIEDPYKAFSDSIGAKVKEAFSSPVGRQCSIFRVHEKFHKMNHRAYSPDMISIGPLHRGKPSLQAMEPIKLMYMHDLLCRIAEATSGEQDGETSEELPKGSIARLESIMRKPTTKPKSNIIEECSGNKREIEEDAEPKTRDWLAILRMCAKFIESVEEESRNCYSEPITLEPDEFVHMMVIDGLFIIELFCRRAKLVEIDWYDPIFSKTADVLCIARDLLMVENQIPIFVLTGLLMVVGLKGGETVSRVCIDILALKFFNDIMPRGIELFQKYKVGRGKHLLSFFASTFHPSPKNEEVVNNNDTVNEWKTSLSKLFKFHTTPKIVEGTSFDPWAGSPNATKMKRSGIKFKKGSTTDNFLDIKFDIKKGELEIPELTIDDSTEIFFRNIIALEQCSRGETYMSSYGFFMDSLIDSAEDVQILVSNGIITNYLGNDDDVTNLYNKLCSGVTIKDYYYFGLSEELSTYCSKEINIWKATMQRDYCNSPCATISFLAAILLLVLTLTSTVFAIIPVARPS